MCVDVRGKKHFYKLAKKTATAGVVFAFATPYALWFYTKITNNSLILIFYFS